MLLSRALLLGAIVGSLVGSTAGCGPRQAPTGGAPAEIVAATPGGVAIGAKAPDGTLTDARGSKVALAELLHRHARSVLVFYRGFW